jgi:hypothetical protein
VEVQKGNREPSEPEVTGNSDYKDSFKFSEATRWRAPELANENFDAENHEKIMEKADVQSFAMTSLEVSVLFAFSLDV